jgi:glycosyltransferase involved in cell wall biosynthesis
MIEDKIEINLITYNRAKSLDRTLVQLRQGPFARCKITILDNCSTDETPEVCARHQALFPNLQVLRHRKNIGLSANYLRAVEISTSLYTWVLCDDDTYDFSDCADVLAAIEEGTWDWINVGAPGQREWERGLRTSTRELWKRGSRFFFVHTFVPSLIFKTDLFDSECMVLGYHNAANSYPHYRFVTKGLEQNFSEYVSRRPLVHRDDSENAFFGLYWWNAALNSAATISDRRTRRLAIYEARLTRWDWLKTIAEHLFVAKLNTPQKVPRQYLQMAMACVGEQRLRLLLLSPIVLVPSALYRFVRQARRSLQGRTHGDTDPYPRPGNVTQPSADQPSDDVSPSDASQRSADSNLFRA